MFLILSSRFCAPPPPCKKGICRLTPCQSLSGRCVPPGIVTPPSTCQVVVLDKQCLLRCGHLGIFPSPSLSRGIPFLLGERLITPHKIFFQEVMTGVNTTTLLEAHYITHFAKALLVNSYLMFSCGQLNLTFAALELQPKSSCISFSYHGCMDN